MDREDPADQEGQMVREDPMARQALRLARVRLAIPGAPTDQAALADRLRLLQPRLEKRVRRPLPDRPQLRQRLEP